MTIPDLSIDPTVLGAALSAWLLTYLIHSTILLLIAWVVTRVCRTASNITLEAVWRVAVVGGIVTATIAITLPGDRAMHEFTLSATRSGSPIDGAPAIGSSLEKESDRLATEPLLHPDFGGLGADFDRIESQAGALPLGVVPTIAARSAGNGEASRIRTLQLIWLPLLGIVGAVWAVVSIAVAHDRLRRRLGGRIAIDDSDLLTMLASLRSIMGFRRRVGLWSSSAIDVPMALGTIRPGICVPTRFLADLSPEHQRRVLAHELAHLIRRDPLWVGVSRLIACMCFFQPLNWLALRRLRELAEYECDRIAVACTGGRFGFARCLTEVANWLVADYSPANRWQTAAMVSSMARSRSNLRRRIERLVHEENGSSSSSRPHRWLVAVTFALIGLAMTGLSPRVRAVADDVRTASDDQQSDVVNSLLAPEELADADAWVAALADIAREIDGIAVDIRSLSQRIDLLEGGGASDQSNELMASLDGRLAELRAQRHALLESILHESTRHQSTTEDVQ